MGWVVAASHWMVRERKWLWAELRNFLASLVAQMVKHLPTMLETWVRMLGWEDFLEKEMATHSGILAWRIPWTEEPAGLQSMGSQRVGHDWPTSLRRNWTTDVLGGRHLRRPRRNEDSEIFLQHRMVRECTGAPTAGAQVVVRGVIWDEVWWVRQRSDQTGLRKENLF